MSQRYPGLATVVIGWTDPAYWIGVVASDPAEAQAAQSPFLLTIRFGHEAREQRLGSLDTSGAIWTGTLYRPDLNREIPVTVRPTIEDDALVAYSMSACPAIPLPVPVLDYMHTVEFTVPNLYAMSDDDGFVVTMMLNSDAGLYVRYASMWHRLVDDDVVDGLNVTEVDDASFDMFDQFDRAGQLVHVSAMPFKGQPIEAAVQQAPSVGQLPVMAGALVRDVPLLSSAEDLPAAIAQAEADPELRWWVERRVKALGIEASLPWA